MSGRQAAVQTSAEVPALIDGEWLESSSGEWLERHDPSDATVLVARSPAMTAEDADRALAAARRAAPVWRATPFSERAAILRTAATQLRADTDAAALDIVREAGLVLAEARGEATRAPEVLEYYAGLADELAGRVLADRRPGVQTILRREPLGTVLAITPWNNPALVVVRKLAPALIAGDTVVLKPAEHTPLSALRVVRCLVEAGLPDGVVNLLTGRGALVGARLVSHVDGVTFTGSTAVGRALLREGAERGIRVQAEMGGKNALYLDASGDVEQALAAVRFAGFGQAGQRCTATSRVLVDRSRYPEVLDRLTALADGLRVGPALADDVDVGPLVDARAAERVLAAIAHARQDRSGRLLAGGIALTDGDRCDGHFVAPTVFADVEPRSRLWRDEVFGPVVAVRPVDGLDDAIAEVNDSRYGLTAAIFTHDLPAARRFAREVRIGNVSVNLPTVGWDVGVPFGGRGDSGSDFKEQGREGLDFYVRPKVEAIDETGFA